MIFNTSTPPTLQAEITALFPKAIKLIDHVIKEEKLLEGTTIVNHPDVPPTIVTKEMLENNFPSLQESFYWFVVE